MDACRSIIQEDRYELLGLLGQGSYGAVYKVRDRTLDCLRAVKVLKASPEDAPEIKLRFLREGQVLAKLQHPNIVRFFHFEAVEEQSIFFYVMEYVEGESLAKRLTETGAIEPARIIELFSQLASALSAIHANGLMHRDLKPANLILQRQEDGSERLKLIDFGFCKTVNSLGNDKLTKTGYAVGTLAYMSPEALIAHEQDHRSDLYAVGCIMYECLTGKSLITESDQLAVAYHHISNMPPPPHSVCPNADIPAILEDIVLRLIQKDPALRYADAEELLSDLKTAQQTLQAKTDAKTRI